MKIKVYYDKKGDYLEINLKKCKNTYFDEVKKDFSKIIETKTGNIVGYTLFNFTKKSRNLKIHSEV